MEDVHLHFSSYEKVLVNENHNIPTLVYHSNDNTYIGYEALDKVDDPSKINKNFKIDIGLIDSTNFSTDYKYHTTADGNKVSATKLADLFLNKVLKSAEVYFEQNSFDKPDSILIAEPLVLQNDGEVDEKWLSLYRKNLRRYFERKGFTNISFLPEPFAVFQYYKYCKKFAPLNKDEQLLVFVIDFGGGTFDTCLIETTLQGEIKEGGKNSKPLGASSIAKGGSDLDKAILNFLLCKYHSNEDAKIKKAFHLVSNVQKAKTSLDSLSPEHKLFIHNYIKALVTIQKFKEILSNNIRIWNLDAALSESVSISLPKDFFKLDSVMMDYQITASQFRDLFVNFYREKFKTGIKLTLERGLSVTKKKKPDYILLSGGSSNIGWLNELLKLDFAKDLSQTEIVKLDNYKEVVSAGLAVECGRRFYNETGDFADTTYNTINLVLNPNNRGIEIPKYKPLSVDFKEELKEGILIPSSTILRKHFNNSLKWRYKLHSTPKNEVCYYFLRNSVDPQDIDNLQNLLSTRKSVDTKSFDKYSELELTIKEDGTAQPRFIFNSRNEKDSIVNCEPFFIDMTYGDEPQKTNSYLGIDFGTCNSSVSYISNKHIEKYNEQSLKVSIKQSKDMLDKGPFPISYHLAKFHNEFDDIRKAKTFMQLFENSLALLYYIILVEINTVNPNFNLEKIKIFRAAGSLLLGFKSTLSKVDPSCPLSYRIKSLFNNDSYQILDGAVKFINDFKHDKTSDYNYDFEKSLNILFLANHKLFEDNFLGFFDRVSLKPFEDEYLGEFICSHGNGIFTNKLEYNGKVNINKQYCYVVDTALGKGLNLFPLLHWDLCPKHKEEDHGHCYFFDKYEGQDLIFSSVTGNCEKRIDQQNPTYRKFDDAIQSFYNNRSFSQIIDLQLSEKKL